MNKLSIVIKDMTPGTAHALQAASQLRKMNRLAEIKRLKQHSESIRREMIAIAAH